MGQRRADPQRDEREALGSTRVSPADRPAYNDTKPSWIIIREAMAIGDVV